jgi:tetratricopeptide (TPR) repeat protein
MNVVRKGRAVLAAALLAVTPVAAQAKGLRAESPHFVVYANSGESTLRDYVQDIEDYDRLLRSMHRGSEDGAAGGRLEIYLINGASDLRQVFPEMSGPWAGVYTASPEGVFAIAFKPSGLYGQTPVRHEYYHHFMQQYFPGGYPGWMMEGMADFFSTSFRRGGKQLIGGPPPGRMDTLAILGWLPLDQVLSKGPFAFKGNQVSIYYAEAWLLTNYMMTDLNRRRQLVAYVDALRAGSDPVKAWVETVGETPDVTQRKLRHVQLKAIMMDRQPAQPVEIAVSSMPASADDMLLEGQQLKKGVPDDQGKALLADIRADAAKHPADRLSDLVLARAEIELGDAAAAEPLLKRRLEADPNDVEARLLKARSLMRAGDDVDEPRRTELYREADRTLVPALKVNAQDFRLLYAYARSRSVEDDYPSKNIEQVMLNAVALAPQVSTVRFNAADICEARGDYDLAIGLLQPMVNDPHSPGTSRAAQERIEALNKRKSEARPAR